MRNKVKESSGIVPKIRFPQFKGAWNIPTLGDISDRITQKVGTQSLETISISAGIGFVSQAEKFSRDISGEQYKNYIVLNEGEFSYNKGNSKKFPQGCVYKLTNFKRVAAPNAFISFKFKKDYVADFYQGYFETNFHGEQLKKFITSGARSNGLLNISPDDFFSIKLPTPIERKEQQMIADCLLSANELIEVENKKLIALQQHKKGLMQELFPADEEVLPNRRFPEFQDAPEWTQVPLAKLLLSPPDYGVNAPSVPYTPELPTYLRITDISEDGRFLSENKTSVEISASKEHYLEEGDIVFARTGASVGKTYKYQKSDGKLVFAGFLIRIKINSKKVVPTFLYNFLLTPRYWKWVKITSARSGQPGINSSEYAALRVPIPVLKKEQEKIADVLSSLDDLISAQSQKVNTLRLLKKGLIQQLLPSVSEVQE